MGWEGSPEESGQHTGPVVVHLGSSEVSILGELGYLLHILAESAHCRMAALDSSFHMMEWCC